MIRANCFCGENYLKYFLDWNMKRWATTRTVLLILIVTRTVLLENTDVGLDSDNVGQMADGPLDGDDSQSKSALHKLKFCVIFNVWGVFDLIALYYSSRCSCFK